MSATTQHPMSGVESLTPPEVARLVQERGVAKANASFTTTFVLGVLAGAFIALGAMFSTVVATGSTFGYGPTKLLAGLAFSLGLILVVVAGAEAGSKLDKAESLGVPVVGLDGFRALLADGVEAALGLRVT